MLRITYEYECDVCKKPIRGPQTFKSNIYSVLPPPMTANRVGSYDVCDECVISAYAALHDRVPKQENGDGTN